jgi:hypothetical protein
MHGLTYLLTPWSRVLLEKLTGLQLVKKFPAFYGTQRFITALTTARHLSLSWASSIQSTHPHSTSRRSILILSSHLRLSLPSGLLPYGFPHQNPVHTSPLTHTRYMPRPSHSSNARTYKFKSRNFVCNISNSNEKRVRYYKIRILVFTLGARYSCQFWMKLRIFSIDFLKYSNITDNYCSLNVKVAHSKNCPFGVNTKTELKCITTGTDNNDI